MPTVYFSGIIPTKLLHNYVFCRSLYGKNFLDWAFQETAPPAKNSQQFTKKTAGPRTKSIKISLLA